MRSKLNTSLVLTFFGLFTVATACGDDNGTGSPGNGEAGESGAASGGDGPMSSGGSETVSGGAKPNGGEPSVNGGSPSGNAGQPSVNGGNGGEPSANGGNGGEPSVNGGESGSGGAPSGNGGEPSGSGGADAGAGGGGPVTCTPLTLSAFEGGAIEPTFTEYSASFTPNIGAPAADLFLLSVQAPPAYDGDETGTFDLTENGDENYKTCSRCFLVIADPNGARTVFYPTQGTLVIDPASTQLDGTIDATVSNLTLVEVTIANDYTSTPVPNGRCVTVASAEIAVTCAGPECIPAGWTCDEDFVGDGDCDCGCGAKDPECGSTTNVAECDYCVECRGDFNPCVTGDVDPADTTMCL